MKWKSLDSKKNLSNMLFSMTPKNNNNNNKEQYCHLVHNSVFSNKKKMFAIVDINSGPIKS